MARPVQLVGLGVLETKDVEEEVIESREDEAIIEFVQEDLTGIHLKGNVSLTRVSMLATHVLLDIGGMQIAEDV